MNFSITLNCFLGCFFLHFVYHTHCSCNIGILDYIEIYNTMKFPAQHRSLKCCFARSACFDVSKIREKVSTALAQVTFHLLSSPHPLSGLDGGCFLVLSVKATRPDY